MSEALRKGLQIREDAGVYYLEGPINEHSQLDKRLPRAEGVLRLNLVGLTGLTSLGVRQMTNFMRDRASDAIELHECPRLFIDLVNMLPDVVGGPRRAARVKTFYAPFACTPCGIDTELLVSYDEVKIDDRGIIKTPVRRCDGCRRALALAIDSNEYMLFISNGS